MREEPRKLALVLPPAFAEACGYHGCARYVALCWIPDSGLLWSDDGHAHQGTRDALLTLCSEPANQETLSPFLQANSSGSIRPWLLIDRDEGILSFGTAVEIWAVLETQADR